MLPSGEYILYMKRRL